VLLMRAFGVQPVNDATAAAARYGGAELRGAEEQREQQRQARIAELRLAVRRRPGAPDAGSRWRVLGFSRGSGHSGRRGRLVRRLPHEW
jgi:hypothetical protein